MPDSSLYFEAALAAALLWALVSIAMTVIRHYWSKASARTRDYHPGDPGA